MNKNLKNRRDETGLTQVQVAEKAGITAVSYQRIEYGSRRPSLKTAQLIARALNTTVEKLFPIPERQFGDIEEKPDGNQCRVGSSERPTR